MYRYRYINKHYQFGQTNYSLILEDLEDGMPTVRVEKSFSLDPSMIDDNFLAEQANIDIVIALKSWADFQVAAQLQADILASQDVGDQ